MQAIIFHYSLLSFRSDELCIHLSIVGLAEASTGGEMWGETVSISRIKQVSHLQGSFWKVIQKKF